MIHVFGTSHVSNDSLDLVEEKIKEIDPDMVALELDMLRLESLLTDQDRSGGPIFVRLLQYFQNSIGEKTGVMPGEEMLHAYRVSEEKGIEVALIDQDIRQTVKKLKGVRFSEKLKAVAQLLLGILMPKRIQPAMDGIPDDEMIDRLLFEFEFKFPEMYQVLVEQRNYHMIESLKALEGQVDGDIVVFVGAAHRKAVQKAFDSR